MKISNIQPIQSVQKYQHNQERPAAKGRSAKKEDQVQISDKAKELLKNKQAPTDPAQTESVKSSGSAQTAETQTTQSTKSSVESARAEKLQRIKQELANGTYEVDAGKLAEKLLPVLLRENDDTPNE